MSPRTVRRDVDRLRDLNYPVRATKGPQGGYRLDAGSELPPLLFNDEQAIAVAVALQTATSSVTGIEEGALRALATVRQVMRFDYVTGAELWAAQEGGAAQEEQPWLPARRVEPPSPGHVGRARYLVAWDLDRADWRTPASTG